MWSLLQSATVTFKDIGLRLITLEARYTVVEYALMVDYARCVGCKACELACQEENGTSEGVSWIHNVTVGPEVINGKLVLHFISFACMHCGTAPCIEVCPAKAIARRADGIVLIDDVRCIGCKYCLWVCPFGAPQFDPKRGKMEKCRLCVQRIEKGHQPACVITCHTKALKFGTTTELSEYARKKSAKKVLRIPFPLISSIT